MNRTKPTPWLLLGLLGIPLLAAPGCGKKEPPPPPTPEGGTRIYGIDLDVPRFEQEFTTASPELQRVVQQIKRDCRTYRWQRVGATLEKLGADPTLTDSQKKAVADLADAVRRVVEKQAAAHGR
jgi:hypothetical protein